MRKVLLAFACLAAALSCRADAPSADVMLFKNANGLFAKKGGALVQNDLFKVQAGKRVPPGPWQVEIHTRDTDVFYIVKGSATFVTGGQGVGMHETAPGELRGTSIAGGTERHLETGDVIVIPNGTPHLFTHIDGDFLYFVVKVTRQAE